jgi:GT2 family glycosyltransferase/glycosyltransferase involved in cell wall biosynthesis
MTRPRLMVTIVTHDSEEVVGACLRALPAAVGADVDHVTVVVDNASADATLARIEDVDPDVVVVALDDNRGYAAGINAALRRPEAAGVEAVLVLNPDVRLAPASVPALLEALREPAVGVTVPRLVDGHGVPLPSLRREPTLLRATGEAVLGGCRSGRVAALGEMVVDEAAYTRRGTVDWATGAAMLISRECLDVVGAWDESFFLYSEETDFCLRARDAGFDVRYEPSAGAVHLGGESNTSPQLWAELARNRVRLYAKRHGRVRTAAFRAVVVANEALRAPFRATSRAALCQVLVADGPPVPATGGTVGSYVCFSAQDWWYFNRGHSDFQLMVRVAERRPVLLVNSLGMRMPRPGATTTPGRRITRKALSMARGLRQPLREVPGFHVMTPWFLPVYGDGLVGRLNRQLVLGQVRRAMRRLDLQDPAVVVTLPTAWPVASRLRRARTVAYRSDRYSALPDADGGQVAGLERELLAAADLAVFSSEGLLTDEAALTRRPALLGHGVDLERFRLAEDLVEHPSLRVVPHPRIGYVGMIDGYTVDVGLLERVARDHPHAQLVLVGPVEVDLSALRALPNVHHLGVVPFTDVPSVLAGLDVALMPWLGNEWIHHCNPIKLREYLAVGLPVVSTDFPEVRRHADVVTVAVDAERFSAAVGAASWSPDPRMARVRREAVSTQSWDQQAARLVAWVEAPVEPAATEPAGVVACAAS